MYANKNIEIDLLAEKPIFYSTRHGLTWAKVHSLAKWIAVSRVGFEPAVACLGFKSKVKDHYNHGALYYLYIPSLWWPAACILELYKYNLSFMVTDIRATVFVYLTKFYNLKGRIQGLKRLDSLVGSSNKGFKKFNNCQKTW